MSTLSTRFDPGKEALVFFSLCRSIGSYER